MGLPVLVLGESGSGKTYSIKNFDTEEVGIFSVEKNRLPFKKKFKVAKNATYSTIMKVLKDPKLKTYIIDDSQYLLVNQLFDGMNSSDQYKLFKQIAQNFRDLIHYVNSALPDDVIVYFLHHTQETNSGKIKAKTVGKMLDDVLTVEGCFDIYICTMVDSEGFHFVTDKKNPYGLPAKTPEEMFEPVIPNDLKMVDTAIRRYYMDSESEA